MVAALALALAFAGWQRLRPYDWHADPAVGYRIVSAAVEPDQSFAWLTLELKRRDEGDVSFDQPFKLVTAAGREIGPVEIQGGLTRDTTEIHLRYWLEAADFAGPLQLRFQSGTLVVRQGDSRPATARLHSTSRW